ncbi:MAG: acyltransferase [Bacteroidales bacterium]|nr:acyltransferase [Bacteroidales bacterium]
MKIRNIDFSLMQIMCLITYYLFAQYLPSSGSLFFGGGSKKIRYCLCKHIFKSCGKNVNIERRATFGSGRNIEIGDNSGIGINAVIPSNTIIGKNVMMGPNCYILAANHSFERLDIPMCLQGFTEPKQTIIGNDCWIGRDVLMTPGRVIKDGSIIAGGTVLCKDFPKYSIVGGNPSRLIKSRIPNDTI